MWLLLSAGVLLVAAVSAVPTKVPEVQKYSVHIEESGTHFTQNVTVDLDKNQEIIEVPAHNAVKATRFLHDFNKNLTMMLLHESQVCLMYDMSSSLEAGSAVRPGEFAEALESAKRSSGRAPRIKTLGFKWVLDRRLKDEERAGLLSDDMIDMCQAKPVILLRPLEDQAFVTAENGTWQMGKSHENIHRQMKRSPSTVAHCPTDQVGSRCKIQSKVCEYLYYKNCKTQQLRTGHCKDNDTWHIYNDVVCCKACCKIQSGASSFKPFCDTYNDFSCPREIWYT